MIATMTIADAKMTNTFGMHWWHTEIDGMAVFTF